MAALANTATSETHLCACSSALGMSSITSAPAAGRNTMRVRPQSVRNSLFIGFYQSDEDDEGAGEERGRPEEEGAVLLHLAGRQLAEDLAAALGGGGRAVDGPVDDLLVDVRVDPAAAGGGEPAGAVDHPVDHVLVEPVDAPRDRALGAGRDHVGVKVVEVVLVDQRRVAGVGQGVALADAAQRDPARVPGDPDADAQHG